MPSNPPRRPARLRGIGFRTSVAVSTVVLVAVAGFIALDAVRETREYVRERTAALDEEAMTIHRAVARPAADPGEVQRFIDGVCLRMSDTTSPGHHIVVEDGGRVFQSRPHRRESDEIVGAIRAAASDPQRQATFGDVGIVSGVHAEDGVTFYVAEQLDDIRREVRGGWYPGRSACWPSASCSPWLSTYWFTGWCPDRCGGWCGLSRRSGRGSWGC